LKAPLELGIDIGGTFTDLTLRDSEGALLSLKTPTHTGDPARGIADAIAKLEDQGILPDQIEYFVHGTTIALNSIIQRSGANTALIVTEGFRDVLELARLRVPVPFSFYSTRPTPLVPREKVISVRERVLYDGSIETELEPREIERVLSEVAALQVESVAICLLHAYMQPAHELRLQRALEQVGLDLFVSCSSQIWPEIREYERTLVTVMNSYVGPPAARYLGRLDDILRKNGVRARPYLTRSNGGIMTSLTARSEAVHLLLSGPASGVIGAARVAQGAGIENLITFDMGGTSADIAVIDNGRVAQSTDEQVGDFPVIVPSVAISSIGAGGGSIASVDSIGMLKVGPRSAGAEPGPACYGLGGSEATVTDAFLLCGLLDPNQFAGKQQLDVSACEQAMASLGDDLGRSIHETAGGILDVALGNMHTELTGVIERRGLDPRDYVLLAYGGAGPLMACLLAEETSIRTVLFPPSPGTLCAFGALNADVTSDFVRTVHWRPPAITPRALEEALNDLAAQASDWLEREAPPVAESEVHLSADMRYVGQSYELDIPLPVSPNDTGLWEQLEAAFHLAHQARFGQSDPDALAELVTLRARAIGRLPRRSLARLASNSSRPVQPFEHRDVQLSNRALTVPVYDRADFTTDDVLAGPAIIQQPDTTVWLPPRWSGTVDQYGSLVATADHSNS
jgi:N-methylhydantoinase A